MAWINRCEQFFRGQRTADTDKVWLASYHLTGIAQHWYYQLERDAGIPSWAHLKDLCHLRFGPPIRSNPLSALARLPFGNSVQEYINQFLALLCRTDALTPTHQMQLFASGLLDQLRIDVELQNPVDLQIAMSLARAYELQKKTTPVAQPPGGGHTGSRPSGWQRPSTPLPTVPRPQALGGATTAPPQPTTQPSRPLRRLTPTEMAERRKQGLFFNCDK